MYRQCHVTKLVKSYQLFTLWWYKSLSSALTNMKTGSIVNNWTLHKAKPPHEVYTHGIGYVCSGQTSQQ